jgi:hypothetical protein
MNTTNYRTRDIHSVLRKIAYHENAITLNTCGHDGTLCELPHYDTTWENTTQEGSFVKIISADDEKEVIDIEWAVDYEESYEEAGDAWEFRYRTLIESKDLKDLIDSI